MVNTGKELLIATQQEAKGPQGVELLAGVPTRWSDNLEQFPLLMKTSASAAETAHPDLRGLPSQMGELWTHHRQHPLSGSHPRPATDSVPGIHPWAIMLAPGHREHAQHGAGSSMGDMVHGLCSAVLGARGSVLTFLGSQIQKTEILS